MSAESGYGTYISYQLQQIFCSFLISFCYEIFLNTTRIITPFSSLVYHTDSSLYSTNVCLSLCVYSSLRRDTYRSWIYLYTYHSTWATVACLNVRLLGEPLEILLTCISFESTIFTYQLKHSKTMYQRAFTSNALL